MGGPDQNSTQLCIVFCWMHPKLHKRLTHLVFFFFFPGCISRQYSGQQFIGPVQARLGRGFVEERPPAGIREDSSGAFRWVFHRLLSPQSSRNIIGTVHFVPASLLCPIVAQSICLSTPLFLFMSWSLPLLCDRSPIHTPFSKKRSIFFFLSLVLSSFFLLAFL